jgi:hypothetical protein
MLTPADQDLRQVVIVQMKIPGQFIRRGRSRVSSEIFALRSGEEADRHE